MHWEKAPPSVLASSRPYQGVRVRDPVKELLRRKRSLEPHAAKTAPSTVDAVQQSNQSSYAQGGFGFEAVSGASANSVTTAIDGVLHCTGWRAQPTATAVGLQPALTHWSSPDCNQPDPSVQTLAYPASSSLTADMYMQTLCPSYTVVGPPTMLTYTHAPLLTNFGTIPVAPAPASHPQVDLQDSGLTYIPWAQPLTTLSAMPTSGVQLKACSAGLPGSPLVHMPLPMSLTTMIPQLEAQGLEPLPQPLEFPQLSENQLNPESQPQSLDPNPLDEDPDVEPESPNPLEKLLEDPKAEGEDEGKDTYSNSLFLTNV
ncbi:POU domain class 2-associating factor 1 [Polymixia lowei]